MNSTKILQRSWQMVWQYPALWILGMVLALTAANTFYLGPWQDKQNMPSDNKIKISEYSTIILPGKGLTIDLTTPGGPTVIFTDSSTGCDFQSLADLARQVGLSNLIAVATEVLILVILISLIATVARYVAETAMIRMVSETEETGKWLTLSQGMRMGWSVRAARLFLIDLLVALAGVGFVALMLSLIIGPILLIEPLGIIATLLTALGTFGVLILFVFLFLLWGTLLSLIMQTVRRACIIDDMGVFASIHTGIKLLRHHLQKVGTSWLIWIAIRILWAPMSMLVLLILSPIVLIFMLTGVMVGFVPAAAAAGISSLFVNGATPWIIGAIAGLPVFILVTILPLLFIGGWVEIYKSSLWTLTYCELSAMEHTVQAAQPKRPLITAHGISG